MVAGTTSGAGATLFQTRLQQIILSWDYFQLFAESRVPAKKLKRGGAGDAVKLRDDPNTDQTEELAEALAEEAEQEGGGEAEGDKEEAEAGAATLQTVPDTFADAGHYLSVFIPLLLEECCAQIVRGQEEPESGQCQQGVLTRCERANEFHFATLATSLEASACFNETDLILISKQKPSDGGGSVPTMYALASVEAREGKSSVRVRLALAAEDGLAPLGVRRSPAQLHRARLMQAAMEDGSSSLWYLTKLCNLATITREYTALQNAAELPFFDVILGGKARVASGRGSSDLDWSIPGPLLANLESTHNQYQLEAIRAGVGSAPVVLIQGPPGTGKTQTILGLLSVVLHSQHTPLAPAQLEGLTVARPAGGKGELSKVERRAQWLKASPWLSQTNPRDKDPCEADEGWSSFGSPQWVQKIGAVRKRQAHVLVCTPSNAALDELVLRILASGLRDTSGSLYSPKVVRVGLTPHHSVSSVAMDNLVAQRLQSMDRSTAGAGAARSGSAGVERDRVRTAILDEAAIVCSTLAFSGSGVFSRMSRGFDVVIIDEAAQAVEPSTLVPLSHGCRRLFLVGDPVQLPATVLSTRAVKYGYGTSMFQRLQQAGYPIHMLRMQYRMHSLIRQFPSREFYSDELQDAPGVDDMTRRPWHKERLFGPFFFFDVAKGREEQAGAGSWINKEEAELIVCLYRHLVALHPVLKGTTRVAIISPYKQQVKLLREQFKRVLGPEMMQNLDINTIDGFQGREKDVVIFSCVRADRRRGIGFVSDYRRMNVGITRARASMLVVGCAAVLRQDKHWGNLVKHARTQKRFAKAVRPYHKLFTEESLKAMQELTKAQEKPQSGTAEAPQDKPDPGTEQEGMEKEGEVEDEEEQGKDAEVEVTGRTTRGGLENGAEAGSFLRSEDEENVGDEGEDEGEEAGEGYEMDFQSDRFHRDDDLEVEAEDDDS